MVGVLIDKLDTCWYSGRRMKTEGYWVEMACPPADILLALHRTTQQDMVGLCGMCMIWYVYGMENDMSGMVKCGLPSD